MEISQENARLIIDVGLPLFDQEGKALDSYALRRSSLAELHEQRIVPSVAGLFRNDGPLPLAILLSHAHLDHTGLVEHSQPQIPILASRGTSKMMLAGKLFAGQVLLPPERFQELKPETPMQIGPFTITAYPVDHSIYGCFAFLIEADGKSVLYSGDLRMHGRKPGMHRKLISSLGPKQIDLMLMEGTHFSFPDGNDQSEYELENAIVKEVGIATGLVLVSFSPLHVDRLVGFLRAAIKNQRQFVLDVYTAFVLYVLRSELNLPEFGKDGMLSLFIPNENDAKKLNRISSLKSQAEPYTITTAEISKDPNRYMMMFRPTMAAAFTDGLPPNTTCIYSRWNGYLESDEWKGVAAQLNESAGKLIDLHTSGHIFARDISRLISEIGPKRILPIHTFNAERFKEEFEQTVLLDDGVSLEI